MKIHIVQKGDTLWKIAKKYGVNFEELKKLNSQLSNPDMIMPGMKVKVPTTGGMIKKETPVGPKPEAGVNLGVKKEMPLAEHPFAKEKPMPIVEAPIKEAPIIKEAPKAPYTPKMPIIPEIDINNYYTMNMANMTVQQAPPPPPAPELPPKPVVLPPVKEVPKQEVPVMEVPVCPPPVVEQPICEPECVPMTPIMPGTGFCPPMDPVMPFPDAAVAGMPMTTGAAYGAGMPMTTGTAYGAGMPIAPIGTPNEAGSYIQPHFEDESSSSYLPQMTSMNPGYFPGGVGGGTIPSSGAPVQPQYSPQGMAQQPLSFPPGQYQEYPAPGGGSYYPPELYSEAFGGYPAGAYPGYPGVQGGYPAAYPGTYGAPSPGYSLPTPGYVGPYPGYREWPNEYGTGNYLGYSGEYPPTDQTGPTGYRYQNPPPGAPAYGNPGYMPPAYGQMPYGYPVSTGVSKENEAHDSSTPPKGLQALQDGKLSVGTGKMGDCGCGAASAVPQSYVPTTPPVYMAPYTSPASVAPPFMNPYGIGPMGEHPYGMLREKDESHENGS